MYGSAFFTFGATQSKTAHDPEEDGPTSPRNVRTYRFKASQKFRIQKNAAVRILRCARYTSHSMPVTYAAPLEHFYGPEKKFNLVQQNLLPLVLQGILCFQYNSCLRAVKCSVVICYWRRKRPPASVYQQILLQSAKRICSIVLESLRHVSIDILCHVSRASQTAV